MRVTPNAQKVAAEILEAFRSGAVPKALAITFLTRHLDSPSTRWSRRNRLIAALRGHSDARGFRQWGEVGRHVRAGERAFYILGPCVIRKKNQTENAPDLTIDEEEDLEVSGFQAIAVFGYDQTEGEPLPEREETAPFLEALPLLEVARHWGLRVISVSPDRHLGYYLPGVEIGLAVKNLATWTHELVHGADDRLGTLTRGRGQKLDNEVVAELGGAVLLECLGHMVESDRGGAYRYITVYCERHSRDLLSVCTELLDRTCAAVELILKTATELEARQEAA
ncbi:MAG TPA: hypothetical protein VH988_13555 [Thermoanaerobaculia bacterium]|jgi:antirestriction protein ArdC|nr:hypothetical protein [Thermoanaerobaculia bacterium]